MIEVAATLGLVRAYATRDRACSESAIQQLGGTVAVAWNMPRDPWTAECCFPRRLSRKVVGIGAAAAGCLGGRSRWAGLG
ncbi:MAG: hypothetical protein WAN22_17515, partial [Solirubrobacteraceae bacterium]